MIINHWENSQLSTVNRANLFLNHITAARNKDVSNVSVLPIKVIYIMGIE